MVKPGEPAIVDFIFAGAERTGKTTLKAEIQELADYFRLGGLPANSPTFEFKFYELPCETALAQVVLREITRQLPTAHLVYIFLLTDLSSPVSLEKLPSILDSLTRP